MEAQRETVTSQDVGTPTLLDELLVDARVQRDDEDAYRIAKQGVEAFNHRYSACCKNAFTDSCKCIV